MRNRDLLKTAISSELCSSISAIKGFNFFMDI